MLFELRLTVADRPGSLARLTAVLAEYAVDVREIDFLGSVVGEAVDNVLIDCSQTQLAQISEPIPALPGFTILSVRPSARVGGTQPELDLLLAVARAPHRGLEEFTQLAPKVFSADWAMTFAAGSTRPRWQTALAPVVVRDGRSPLRATRVLPGTTQYAVGGAAPAELAHSPLGGGHVLLLGRNPGPAFNELEMVRINRLVDVGVAVLGANTTAPV